MATADTNPTGDEATAGPSAAARVEAQVRELRREVQALRAELAEFRREVLAGLGREVPPAPEPPRDESDGPPRRTEKARRRVRDVLDQLADIRTAAETPAKPDDAAG